MNPTNEKPKLAAPGAGLPWLELQVMRRIFSFKVKRMNRAGRVTLLDREKDAILARIENVSPDRLSQRVLIKRPPFLEDSSRFWSVYMTLEHLKIVNLAAAFAIRSLGKGQVPDQEASIASVKPSPDAGPEVVDAFIQSCDLLATCAAKLETHQTEATYTHPWFGPMNAAGWHLLGGVHLGIHIKQIDKILAASK